MMDIMDGAVVIGLLLIGFLSLLVLAGVASDYILPHIGRVEQWMHSLPNWVDEQGGTTDGNDKKTSGGSY